VDDERGVLAVVERFAQRQGFDVVTRVGGQALRNCRRSSQTPPSSIRGVQHHVATIVAARNARTLRPLR